MSIETNSPCAQENAPPVSEKFRNIPNFANSSQQDSGDLTEAQRIAIEMLAAGRSVGSIAKKLGINPRTLYNWRKGELFQRELNRRHAQIWEDSALRLRTLIDPSLEVLAEHLEDNYDRARFRAAALVLRLPSVGRILREKE